MTSGSEQPPLLGDVDAQVLGCAACLASQITLAGEPVPILRRTIEDCRGLAKSTASGALTRLVDAELLERRPDTRKGIRGGATEYTFTEAGAALAPPTVRSGCPIASQNESPDNLIPDHFTVGQRQILECMACTSSQASPLTRSGITLRRTEQCLEMPYPTLHRVFEWAEGAGLIELSLQTERTRVFQPTEVGKVLFRRLLSGVGVTCSSPEPLPLDPLPSRAAVMACSGCQLQRGSEVQVAQLKICTGLTRSPLYNALNSLTGDDLLKRTTINPKQGGTYAATEDKGAPLFAAIGEHPTCPRSLSWLQPILERLYPPKAIPQTRAMVQQLLANRVLEVRALQEDPTTLPVFYRQNITRYALFDPDTGYHLVPTAAAVELGLTEVRAILHYYNVEKLVYGENSYPAEHIYRVVGVRSHRGLETMVQKYMRKLALPPTNAPAGPSLPER